MSVARSLMNCLPLHRCYFIRGDAKILKSLSQGVAINPQNLRSSQLVSCGLGQHAKEQRTFDSSQDRIVDLARWWGMLVKPHADCTGKIVRIVAGIVRRPDDACRIPSIQQWLNRTRVDDLFPGQQRQPVDEIAKFTDITTPRLLR